MGSLSRLGASGWELVAIYDKTSNWMTGLEKGFALFKRAVPDGEEPQGAWADAMYADDMDAPPSRNDEMTEAECLSCRASMLPGEDTCKECGWSYSEPSGPNA